MKIDVTGKTALLLNADGAVGTAIGDALAANGATVVRATAGSGRASGDMPLDLAAGKADASVADFVGRFGAPYLLIAVSRGVDTGPAAEPGESGAVDEVEIFAAAAKAFGGHVRRIVNVFSATGIVPVRRDGLLSARQASLASLTRALAMELGGDGIQVNGLAVGAYEAGGQTVAPGFLSHTAIKRPATLGEIAAAALFLSDPANTYTTGHILTVDGGWSAGYARNF